jgi:hypothetical protein
VNGDVSRGAQVWAGLRAIPDLLTPDEITRARPRKVTRDVRLCNLSWNFENSPRAAFQDVRAPAGGGLIRVNGMVFRSVTSHEMPAAPRDGRRSTLRAPGYPASPTIGHPRGTTATGRPPDSARTDRPANHGFPGRNLGFRVSRVRGSIRPAQCGRPHRSR